MTIERRIWMDSSHSDWKNVLVQVDDLGYGNSGVGHDDLGNPVPQFPIISDWPDDPIGTTFAEIRIQDSLLGVDGDYRMGRDRAVINFIDTTFGRTLTWDGFGSASNGSDIIALGGAINLAALFDLTPGRTSMQHSFSVSNARRTVFDLAPDPINVTFRVVLDWELAGDPGCTFEWPLGGSVIDTAQSINLGIMSSAVDYGVNGGDHRGFGRLIPPGVSAPGIGTIGSSTLIFGDRASMDADFDYVPSGESLTTDSAVAVKHTVTGLTGGSSINGSVFGSGGHVGGWFAVDLARYGWGSIVQ